MRTLITIIFFMTIFSCGKKCNDNEKVKKIFFESLNTVIYCSTDNHIYEEKNLIIAILKLDSLTGLESHIKMGKLIYYESDSTLNHDIKMWQNWYKKIIVNKIKENIC